MLWKLSATMKNENAISEIKIRARTRRSSAGSAQSARVAARARFESLKSQKNTLKILDYEINF